MCLTSTCELLKNKRKEQRKKKSFYYIRHEKCTIPYKARVHMWFKYSTLFCTFAEILPWLNEETERKFHYLITLTKAKCFICLLFCLFYLFKVVRPVHLSHYVTLLNAYLSLFIFFFFYFRFNFARNFTV